MKVLAAVNLFLLLVAILALLIWVVPDPPTCWLPPGAPTRGFYTGCWQAWEIWT